MGEISDAIINGEICAFCMLPFIYKGSSYEHGYPVACKDCWEPDCGYEKATADTI